MVLKWFYSLWPKLWEQLLSSELHGAFHVKSRQSHDITIWDFVENWCTCSSWWITVKPKLLDFWVNWCMRSTECPSSACACVVKVTLCWPTYCWMTSRRLQRQRTVMHVLSSSRHHCMTWNSPRNEDVSCLQLWCCSIPGMCLPPALCHEMHALVANSDGAVKRSNLDILVYLSQKQSIVITMEY